jgi:hypothetical protein
LLLSVGCCLQRFFFSSKIIVVPMDNGLTMACFFRCWPLGNFSDKAGTFGCFYLFFRLFVVFL